MRPEAWLLGVLVLAGFGSRLFTDQVPTLRLDGHYNILGIAPGDTKKQVLARLGSPYGSFHNNGDWLYFGEQGCCVEFRGDRVESISSGNPLQDGTRTVVGRGDSSDVLKPLGPPAHGRWSYRLKDQKLDVVVLDSADNVIESCKLSALP